MVKDEVTENLGSKHLAVPFDGQITKVSAELFSLPLHFLRQPRKSVEQALAGELCNSNKAHGPAFNYLRGLRPLAHALPYHLPRIRIPYLNLDIHRGLARSYERKPKN